MGETDHVEPPGLVFARATVSKQMVDPRRAFAVGIRRRIPLGRSAAIGSSCPASVFHDANRDRQKGQWRRSPAARILIICKPLNRRVESVERRRGTPFFLAQNCVMVNPLAN